MNTQSRITKLDGLRGLLSLMVALNHSFMVVVIPSFANVWQQNPLVFRGLESKLQQLFMLIGNGGAAVTLFFLLSGFVLSQSLSRTKLNFKGLLAFLAKRIIRLYPVYLLIVFSTAIYMKLGFSYQTFPFSSAWFNWWMNFQMNFKELVLNILFVHAYVGGVTWTLRVILITSFIFPVFYSLNKKTSALVDILISIFLIYLSFTLLNIEGFRDLRYLYMFYLGLMLPKFQKQFSLAPNRLISIMLPFAALLLLSYRYSTNEYQGGVVESIISFFIIGIAAYSEKVKSLNFLDGKLLQFYGKISYSFYLINFSVLYVFSRLMFQKLPHLPYQEEYLYIHLTLFLLSVLVTTGISLLVYKYIETPSKNFANKVGHKILGE